MRIGRSTGRQQHLAAWGMIFALPALVYIALFQLYPILFAFYISLHDYDLLSQPVYVGFRHFAGLLHDRAFIESLWITLAYVFYTVVPVLLLSFLLAWALTQVRTSRGIWRTLLFVPSIMPIVSVALVWKLIFNFGGPMNQAVMLVGERPIPWLNSSVYAPIALVIMSWWHATSYYMIVFLAGFLSIPGDLYEAAALDGARGLQVLRHITLPAMKPTIALAIVLATVNGLKTFAFQQIVTDGGPADATQIMTLLIYKTSFSYLDMGRASTYSVVLFGGILAISLLQIWFLRERDA